jgi:hypothetical protein
MAKPWERPLDLQISRPALRPHVHATFRVRDKIFAISSPDGDTASIKASLDDQSGLVAMDPDTFAVAAYTGKYGWVRVRLAGVPPELAERLITNAWRRTAPKRLVAKLEKVL